MRLALCALGQANTPDHQTCPQAHMHRDSQAQTHTHTHTRKPAPSCAASPHVGWCGMWGEEVEETALQMLLEIQHVPSTPPSPTSRSTSPKYLLIFIYILCPRCPAPVRSHLLALVPSCQLPSSSLKSRARSCVWLATVSPRPMGVGGGEGRGLAALGRAVGGGRFGDRSSSPTHSRLPPIWDRFSHPSLFHRDFWKGLMDARCQEHRH